MTLPEKHQKTIAKIVEIIKNSVKDDLVSIIIFGSFVRGEFTEKSDYDVLIVISDYEDVKCKNYWKRIKDLVYEEFGRSIDAIFIEESALKDLTNPFTLDILAEGVVVYGKEVRDKEVFKRYHIQPILNLERVLELDGEFQHKEEAIALAYLKNEYKDVVKSLPDR
ncbi:MAG: nucleotidyltransferase domain-containing protein [Methanophagales archaeon]|nr:nucleotidyltransferase domain-containing protein [Methanophagales archaeon]